MSAQSDFLSGLVILIAAMVFFFASQNIEADPFGVGMEPYTFPQAVCLLTIAMALVQLAVAGVRLRREGLGIADFSEVRLFLVWVLPMGAIAFIYIGLIDLFQYLLPTIVALSASLALFGNRGFKWYVALPVLVSTLYYIIFFGIFRLLESPGRVLAYDNYYLFGTMQKFLGV